jgi:hypothetical protein
MKKYLVDLHLNRRYVVKVNASDEDDAKFKVEQMVDLEQLDLSDWSMSDLDILDIDEIDYE